MGSAIAASAGAMGPSAGGSNYYPYSTIGGTSIIQSGLMPRGVGMTIPGVGIYVNPASAHDLGLLRHEFGHVLQAQLWGEGTYFSRVVPTSIESFNLASKYGDPMAHYSTWTEWSANKLSYEYFGEPADWNTNAYRLSPNPNVNNPYSQMPNDLLQRFPVLFINKTQ